MTLTRLRVERELQREHVAHLYGDFRHVQAAAQRHLSANSSILAIWLFGSRARGNVTKGRSGWDLAVITEEEETPTFESGSLTYCISAQHVENDIRCFEIPLNLFNAKRISVGHCAFLVAAEGIPLAERNWKLPLLQPNERLHMDLRAFRIFLTMINTALLDIGQVYEGLADIGSSRAWYGKSKTFVSDSQDLAEGFIKTGFVWRAVHVFWSHKFIELADEARKAGIDTAFVQLIRRLDGASAKDEGSRYEEIVERKVFLAAKRIENLCFAMPDEFVSATRKLTEDNNAAGLNLLLENIESFALLLNRSAQRLQDAQIPSSFASVHVGTTADRSVIETVWRQRNAIVACFEKVASQLQSAFKL